MRLPTLVPVQLVPPRPPASRPFSTLLFRLPSPARPFPQMAPRKAVPPADKRQTTLFKHISGVPPPKKEQPTLDGLWAKKPAKAPAAAAAAGEASTSKGASACVRRVERLRGWLGLTRWLAGRTRGGVAKVDEPDAMAIDEAPVAAAASSSKPAASQRQSASVAGPPRLATCPG